MGAGISPERERQLKYRNLKSIERELKKAGVNCTYFNKAVVDSRLDGPPRFSVTYGETLRASNGEAFGRLSVQLKNQQDELETYEMLTAQKGIDRIKEVYGVK